MSDADDGALQGASRSLVERGARGQSSVTREARAPLTLLLGVTALVLLIACANIANLLLARGAARAGEMAVRLSIGASRGQLVRQLLVESCLLALFGGIGGLLVAQWTLDLIGDRCCRRKRSTRSSLRIDPTVIAVRRRRWRSAPALLFGLFPALHSTRPDLVSALKGQSRPAVRRASGGALPHDAGDRADRAVDGAARRRPGSSPRACSTSAASISG